MLLWSGSQTVGVQDTKAEEAEDKLNVKGWACPLEISCYVTVEWITNSRSTRH